MTDSKNNMIRIYSGNGVTVNLLKGRLEIAGIPSTIRNDSNDSFLLTVPFAIDLYVQDSDYEKAESVIRGVCRDKG